MLWIAGIAIFVSLVLVAIYVLIVSAICDRASREGGRSDPDAY